jgi:hypothetical protein
MISQLIVKADVIGMKFMAILRQIKTSSYLFENSDEYRAAYAAMRYEYADAMIAECTK